MEKFVYIGLGNNGDRFDGTRHNLGIEALRAWVDMMREKGEYQVSEWEEKKEYCSYHVRVTGHKREVDCLFPTTMMNDSGRAVAAYLYNKNISLEKVLVIHDEVELLLGDVKLTVGGSAKGHNGVRSIQQTLGTSEFTRLRLGVGRPPEGVTLSDFVLQQFLPAEQSAIEEMTKKALAELTAHLPQG